MRTVLIAGLLALACTALAQARLVVEIDGKRAGYATISHKLMPDGSKTVSLRLQLGASRMATETTYSAKGEPIRKYHEVLEPADEKQRILVEFDAKGALVTDSQRPEAGRVAIELLTTAPRTNTAEFWFLRDQPKAGDEVRAYNFDISRRQWELVITRYAGAATVQVSGKPVKGHELRVDQGGRQTRAIVDDAGLPLLVDQGRIVMRRFN